MHVFVAGATGVLGRAVVPRLIQAGHKVCGLGRTPEKLLMIDRMGASAMRGDILDAGGLSRLLAEHRPDIAINLTTAIPLRLKIYPPDWEKNDRIRTEGTANLVRACEGAGVSLLVQESVGYVCASRGSEWITEASPLSTHPFLKATIAMEGIVRSARVPGVLLRFAALMSPDAWHTQQSVAALRRGMLPIIGSGQAYLSLIHAEDAALAVLNVIERRGVAAGKTYNVVDDAPATMAEVFRYAARCLGAPVPGSVPPFLARLAVGAVTVDVLTASYRMSSERIRSELEFAPRFPTYIETWRQIADAVGSRQIPASDELPSTLKPS